MRDTFFYNNVGEKMKSVIALVTIFIAASAQAGFTKNYKGHLSEGDRFHCTLTNYSGYDLEVKKVRFYTISSDYFDQPVNKVIYSRETMKVTLEGVNARFFIGKSCFFATER